MSDLKENMRGLFPDTKKGFLAIGVLPQGLQNYFPLAAWRIMGDYAKEIADSTNGEYTAWDVAIAVDAGLVHLHVGYMCDKELTEQEQQGYITQKLALIDPSALEKVKAARAALEANKSDPALQTAYKDALIASDKADLAVQSDGFAGYYLLKLEKEALHIWQAYIVESLRGNPEVFRPAFERIGRTAKLFKAPAVTMASNRPEWREVCSKLGFKEICSIYRMKVE